MLMSGWSCRYQSGEECLKVGAVCKPGMRGCVLIGRVVFADDVARIQSARRAKPHARRKLSRAKQG